MREIGRETLLQLVEARLSDARVLLAAGCFSGAYYLAGYAVELRLKAIIAQDFKENVIPDWREVRDVFTHNLTELIRAAGLQDALTAHRKANPAFARNWSVVREWSEESRYEITVAADAIALVGAIEHPQDGVLTWLTSLSST